MTRRRPLSPERTKLRDALRQVPIESILQAYGRTTIPVGETELLTNCPNPSAHRNGDANPSLALNRDGRFFCRVCGFKGGGAVALVTEFRADTGWTSEQAEADLCEKFLHPIVPEQVVEETHAELMANALVLRDLERIRGLTRATCLRFRLGLDEEMHITIPVPGPYGYVQDLRRWNALRLPLPGAKNMPYETGYGKASHGRWWGNLEGLEAFICEGEPDTLRAAEEGLPSCTVIGGATAFSVADFTTFAGKSVSICMDRDPAGMSAEDTIRERLTQQGAARIRLVRVSAPHKDFTDWIQSDGKTAVLESIEQLPWHAPDQERTGIPTPLMDVTEARLERAEVFIDGQVSTVAMQPFLLPRKYRVRCNGDAGPLCVGCPNSDQGLCGTYTIRPTDEAYLGQLLMAAKARKVSLQLHAGVPPECKVWITILDRQAALPCSLIPGDQRFGKDSTYVSREAIYHGHHIPPGSIGRFRGYSREDPRTRRSILVLTERVRELNPTEGVFLTPEEIADLRSVYDGRDPYDAIMTMADVLSACHTRIAGRRLLHAVVDLVFHSVLMIPYGGIVEPGTLDVLVFGATSTGKGKTAEGLIRLYQRGEVISAKRCTTAGLIGGTVRHNQGFDVVPGAWPLRNGDLVVMDEAIDWMVLQALTRARRDGVAEFTHAGASQRMAALVRKVWIMNPPEGRTLDSYRFGAEIIRDLARTEEDVARWDLAVGVASDVDEGKIMAMAEPLTEEPPVPEDLLRKKVAWAWSRTVKDIRWTMPARRAILEQTSALIRDFSLAEVGLVQRGNTHQKVRKFSVAVAACVFSSPDGESLVVDGSHVLAATRIMREAMAHPVMALDEMTRMYREAGAVGNPRAVLATVRKAGADGPALSRRIIVTAKGQRRTWEAMIPDHLDPTGTVDTWLRERALREDGRDLIVTRAFADLLREFIKTGGVPGDKPAPSVPRRRPKKTAQEERA